MLKAHIFIFKWSIILTFNDITALFVMEMSNILNTLYFKSYMLNHVYTIRMCNV